MRWFLQMCSASGYTGGGSIIAALVGGLEKHGGRLLLNTHVDEIILEEGRAVGT